MTQRGMKGDKWRVCEVELGEETKDPKKIKLNCEGVCDNVG